MKKLPFKRIGVYCGSSNRVHPEYLETAHRVGRTLAERGVAIVFGGGSVGLMGAVADGAIEAGGETLGVIPSKLVDLEVGHEGLTERFVVDSMHSRKSMMANLSDAFIALPGGWGTLEELFEVATMSQLNYHLKPFGVLNVRGYYDHLLAFLEHAAAEGFVRPEQSGMFCASERLEDLLDQLVRVEIPLLATRRL